MPKKATARPAGGKPRRIVRRTAPSHPAAEDPPTDVVPVPSLKRVVLKNFKSIEHCAVDLSPLTLLVGPNGAGKSNFIDGIRLTADAMRSNLENAIRERGGVAEVRRRSRGHPTHFGIRLDLDLPGGMSASYAYQVAARRSLTIEVQREECHVWLDGQRVSQFVAQKGRIKPTLSSIAGPTVAPNSMLLPLLGGLEEFQPVLSALANMGFYNLNLDRIRELQNPDMGELLTRDGSNLASVVRRMEEASPQVHARIIDYLGAVVPGVRAVSAKSLGPKETVEFRQEVTGDSHPWRYLAANVSDGTLRALGVLVAVFQVATRTAGIPMVAIEEPEVAIHPGAALRLMDALLEAARDRQLLLTTHSPDLLDHAGLAVASVLAVQASGGTTLIGPVEAATKEAVRENLYTVGELLRLEQVRPDLFDVARQGTQLRLFGGP